MIDGTLEQSNNGTIEKYCYNNEPDSCTKYGGLYQWEEMMQYITQQGAQGICPPGWHLPEDEEWKVLEGAVDSHYGIGDPEWNIEDDWRGFNAGTKLKSTSGWNEGGNGTNMFGFSGLPAGFLWVSNFFANINDYGYWWTSTGSNNLDAWTHSMGWNNQDVSRNHSVGNFSFSVRCLRDN